jgi:hypothetical protein
MLFTIGKPLSLGIVIKERKKLILIKNETNEKQSKLFLGCSRLGTYGSSAKIYFNTPPAKVENFVSLRDVTIMPDPGKNCFHRFRVLHDWASYLGNFLKNVCRVYHFVHFLKIVRSTGSMEQNMFYELIFF